MKGRWGWSLGHDRTPPEALEPVRRVLPSAASPGQLGYKGLGFLRGGLYIVLRQNHCPFLTKGPVSLLATVLPVLGNWGLTWELVFTSLSLPAHIVLCALILFSSLGFWHKNFFTKAMTVMDLGLRKCHFKTF